MSTDPTGAARTALEQAIDAAVNDGAGRCCGSSEAEGCTAWASLRESVAAVVKAAREAERSHLAGQAGPEVRGLVDAFAASCRAFQVNTSESPLATIAEEEAWSSRRARIIERMNAAEAALLAAYDALRQQRLWCSVCNDQLDGKADICEVCAQTLRQQAETSRAVELAALEEYGKVEAECAALRQQRDEAVAAIAFLRDGYSSYGARACPACVYENGKFIRLCKVHEEAAAERQRADKAEVELAAARKRYPADIKDLSAELEWGEDYDR